MSTPEDNTEKGPIGDREYVDIIHADLSAPQEFTEGAGVATKIIYYCRDCEKIITPKRIGKKLAFSCSECKGSKVSFGREESIINYYRIKGAKLKSEKIEDSEKSEKNE